MFVVEAMLRETKDLIHSIIQRGRDSSAGSDGGLATIEGDALHLPSPTA